MILGIVIRYTSDRHHVMPVITPIFPTHNTTYNVQESNKRVIVREIKRGETEHTRGVTETGFSGREIMELMSMNKSSGATKGNEVTWADLCAPFPFFQVSLSLAAEPGAFSRSCVVSHF